QSDLRVRYPAGLNLPGDLSVVDHEKPVCESRHFLQFSRDQKNGATPVAQPDQLAVNEFDRTNVHAASWLRYEKEFGRQAEFSPNDKLLLVSTGKSARRKVRIRRTDIEITDDMLCPPPDAGFIEYHQSGRRNSRLPEMHAKD